MKNEKSFDCVEMKHKAARSIHDKLKGKSPREKIRFWQEQERSMRAAIGHASVSCSR
jgi:hypothetical protein